MIKIEGLAILLKTFSLTDLHIEIEEGEFHFLLGPTGSGKTLILESIIGLHKPKKGEIWIGEKEVQGLPPEQREISYVPQDLALFPHLSVKENILYGIRAKNHYLKNYEEYVESLIQVMRVGHLLERYPANLSGGEKKRVALLRALAPKPKLLLLDEPLSGLDPSIKYEIQQLLKTLHTSFHPTVLCVSHDFEEAYLLGDKMTVFIDGHVEQVGKRDEVFLKPRTKNVAQFLGLRNLYRGKILAREDHVERSQLDINSLQFSIPNSARQSNMEIGGEIDLYIRPEEIMILREGKPIKESLKRNIFIGNIIDIANRGRHHSVFFQDGEGKISFEISIPNYAFRNLDLSIDKQVTVALRDESFWVMS
ncbi:MAG: ATP-binding cassette domain-containing protein [Deltaproteobacteria bacterium]|nr:ATP-binding cassette domain-containing protein [Deltaproteobacteria bacterium]